eukprot:scaffold11201_cov151-Cylindrotheca_fusiformis.AAC.2
MKKQRTTDSTHHSREAGVARPSCRSGIIPTGFSLDPQADGPQYCSEERVSPHHPTRSAKAGTATDFWLSTDGQENGNTINDTKTFLFPSKGDRDAGKLTTSNENGNPTLAAKAFEGFWCWTMLDVADVAEV